MGDQIRLALGNFASKTRRLGESTTPLMPSPLSCLTTAAAIFSYCTMSSAAEDLPSILDPIGFASPFAGILSGELAIAGGANFPGKLPWEGGQKVWHNRIYALSSPEAQWTLKGHLSKPLAYGCSFPVEDGILCVGGSDPSQHHSRCFLLSLIKGTPLETEWPSLPVPLANASGVRIGRYAYVVGGHSAPDSPPLASVLRLDIENREVGWKSIPPVPGPGRILAAVGHHEGHLYVAGGTDLTFSAGASKRVPLRDAYRFHPDTGWERLPDLPGPRIAPPVPMTETPSGPIIAGGDDATQMNSKPDQHRGFLKETLRFNPSTRRWENGPELPLGIVTAAYVAWRGLHVIPGGEIRPGVRTPRVIVIPPYPEPKR